MKLIIDTVNDDFYMAIINENNTESFEYLKNYKRKSDILPVIFKKLIDEVGISAKDINSIYVVNGPGSFMGIRAGMTFAKTMALVTGAKLFGIDNLTFISKGKDGTYYVDAKGSKSYMGKMKNGIMTTSFSDFKKNTLINYDSLINNPKKYLMIFKEVSDILNYEANYIKEPQVGGL